MTLSQIATLTKQIITISVFALVLGTISFIGYKLWYAYYLAHLPPVEEKPDTRFGILPLPDFPEAKVSSSNFSYSIDTTTGGLPLVGTDLGFEKIIKVYFVTKSFASLLSPERSQNLADTFDLQVNPQIISEVNYRFQDADKTLTVDLDSGNFKFINEATPSSGQGLDDDSKLVGDFKNILSSLGVLNEDLNRGRFKVNLLKNEGDKFVPTTLRKEAVAAQISLWPQDLDKKSILTADFNKALVNATVINGASSLGNYLALNFNYYPIDTTTFATYPIKTAEVAFDHLKNGRGVVIIEPDKPQVSISSIYLGYYLSENYNPYLLPIFVFEGPNFAAFVPATTEQFQAQAR